MKKFVPIFLTIVIVLFITSVVFAAVPAYIDKIAVLRVKGTISSSPSFLYETVSPEEMFNLIDKIENDPTVKGVLMEINSPGGSVVASREIAIAIKKMKKPTVCWMGDIAASGAYWIASACDVIVADPLSLTGSIGATASYLQFTGTMEKYGVSYQRFVSGEQKDSGSPFRNLTEDEAVVMQKLVDEVYKYFREAVIENRNLTDSQIKMTEEGNVMLAKDAIAVGLVDELGTWHDSKDMVEEISGSFQPQFVEMQRRSFSIFDLISGLL